MTPQPNTALSPDAEAAAIALLAACDCLDVDAGLRSVRGRLTTYLRLLDTFLSGHGNDRQTLQAAQAEGRREDAQHLAHSLKGVAGTLGLRAVYASALALNDALHAGQDLAQTAALFPPVFDSLDACCDALRDLLPEVRKVAGL